MTAVTLAFLNEQLELAEQLAAGGDAMFEPQDLPGRFGCVVKAVEEYRAAVLKQPELTEKDAELRSLLEGGGDPHVIATTVQERLSTLSDKGSRPAAGRRIGGRRFAGRVGQQ